jgi:hypothetical protein
MGILYSRSTAIRNGKPTETDYGRKLDTSRAALRETCTIHLGPFR